MNELKLVPVEPQPDYIESSGRWRWPLPPQACFPGCSTGVVTASREWWEYAPSEAKPHPMSEAIEMRDGKWYWTVPLPSEADQRSPLAVAEALGTVFCNMDADGDPVGAQPETDWEKGYAAGLRHVYRVLKQRGFVLPAACSAVSNSEGAALLDTSQQ